MKNIMEESNGGATVSGTNWYGGRCSCDYTVTVGGFTKNLCDIPPSSRNRGH